MSVRSWGAVIGVCGVVLAVSGCSSDDTPMTTTPSSSGEPGNGTGTGTGTGTGSGASLYERLGKKDGIASALHAIVDEELKDTEIASYFFFQVQEPIPAGHPSRAQIEECLTLQLSNAAGGTEQYPAMVSGNFMCRDMKTAHLGLSIPPGIFDRFITIAAGVLKSAKVADADIMVIGSVLNGEKANVAQDKERETGPFKKPTTTGDN